MTQPNRFVFYDYETFGIHPAYDRISQFAAIETDAEFNITGEPLNLYCKQYDDYLPSPEAILITGITPEDCNERGIHEYEFARAIHAFFSKPNSCIVGYNNIRFDDEMTRYLFYRNFYDPYAYSWQYGNSRWDLLDIVRATYALRPEGISWPEEDGLPSFRLELLTKANQIIHNQAHDALSDVYATLEMAKLIKREQPRLFEYFFQNRQTKQLRTFIDCENLTPLIHVSGMFGRERNNLSVIAPLMFHPTNKNAVIALDLMGSLQGLVEETSTTLKEELYTATADLPLGKERVPLKLVHLNKCPVLAPVNTLKGAKILKALDLDYIVGNLAILKESLSVILPKIEAMYTESPTFVNLDAESSLYAGFFSDQDRHVMNQLQRLSGENLNNHGLTFQDDRIAPLLFNYRAKNFYDTLSDEEKVTWQNYAAQKRTLNREKYQEQLQQLFSIHRNDNKKISLLENYSNNYLK